uniref:ribosomal protein L16 n=1 Tax=Campylaephora kondoi TaxID=218449 RepID=UPI002E77C184|nr:ribosomal protein L16 [Campylaephora kondoi]WQF69454.1 ribosomal protein L16 [Campylaephora kondoi]
MKKTTKLHNNYSTVSIQNRHLLQFGNFGFQILTYSRLTDKQIKTIFWLVQTNLKKYTTKQVVKFWFLVFPNLTLTKLSLESRMGKGKGLIDTTAVFIKPGTLICEFDNVSLAHARKILAFITKVFPGKLKLIKCTKQKVI